MTASNVILTHDAAHLITDGSLTNADGKFLMHGAKSFPFPHINAAIVVRGAKDIGIGIADFASRLGSSYDSVKRVVANRLKEYITRPEMAQYSAVLGNDWNDFDFAMAGWSESKNAPDAFFIVSTDRHPGVPPWRVVEPGRYLIAPTHPELLAEFEPRISALASESDSRASLDKLAADLIERQSEIERNVGGFAQVTSITEREITTRVVARYPNATSSTSLAA